MKKYNTASRFAVILAILLLATLFTVAVSAEILPGLDGGGNLPPVTARMPELSEPATDGEYGLPAEGEAPSISDGSRTGGDTVTPNTPMDGSTGSGAMWGLLIAVGIAALAVVSIFLIMPRREDKRDEQGKSRR